VILKIFLVFLREPLNHTRMINYEGQQRLMISKQPTSRCSTRHKLVVPNPVSDNSRMAV
jgi:hypothetical protein